MSSNNGYHRCEYRDETTRECDNWFQIVEDSEGNLVHRFCPVHIGSTGPSNGTNDEVKSDYIRVRNEHVIFCSTLSLDQLDEHIAGIEKVIESERTKLLSARAVRSSKMQDLSDDERKERQKIRYVGPDAPPKRETKAAKLKATIKSDPVKYFMESLGFTQENAETMARNAGLIK